MATTGKKVNDAKIKDLAQNTENGAEQFLTTNQGLRINDNQNWIVNLSEDPGKWPPFVALRREQSPT
jgi:hypothetical protein